MLEGSITLVSMENLKKVFSAVAAVLGKTGQRVEHPEVCRRLAALGAQTSEADGLVRYPEKVLLNTLKAYRGHQGPQAGRRSQFPEKFSASLGDGCFFLYDHGGKSRRKATEEDFVRILRFANAIGEISYLQAPVELAGVPIPVMVVRELALCYLNTTIPCGIENNIPQQVKHLAKLRDVYNAHHETPQSLGNAQGSTSPLIFGWRAAELLLEGMKYGFGHGTYTMAIAGANAPVTPEGCAVQAAAEVLGSMTCIAACDPEHLGGMLALTGTMDMRTGKALFSSPSAILQNIIVTEMFRRVHGVDVGCNWPWYTDAVVPGLQAALEHQTKQIIYAAHSGFPVFHVGDLDGAKLHSNEQMIIDLDVSRGVWEMLKPLAFDDQSLAVAEIERIGAEHGRTHLDSDFTLERHREALWNPRVLPRGYWREGAGGFSEADILDAAHAFYEKTVDAYEPGPLPAGFERDIRKVLDEAQEDLKNLKSG